MSLHLSGPQHTDLVCAKHALSTACDRVPVNYKHARPLTSRIDVDSRDVRTVFYTVFKQNVLESLEDTKVVL